MSISKLLLFKEGKNIGYTDLKGKIVIPAEYIFKQEKQEVTAQYLGLWKEENRPWSKEFTGEETDTIEVFYCLTSDGADKLCLTDFLHKSDYYSAEIEEISDGYYSFFSTNRNGHEGFGIIRFDGKIILEPSYFDITPTDYGFMVTYTNHDEERDEEGDIYEGDGMIDRDGDFIIKPKYKQLEQINNSTYIGLASYFSYNSSSWRKSEFYTLIHINSIIDVEELNLNVQDYTLIDDNPEIIEFEIKDKKGVYCLENRKFIINPNFDKVDYTSKHHYLTLFKDKVVLFDKKGKELNTYEPLLFSYNTPSESVYYTFSERIVLTAEKVEVYKLHIRLHQAVEV